MKAVQIRRYGSSDVLEYVDVDKPEPGRGQLLVKVMASSVNPVDWKMRKGSLRLIRRLKFPFVPGSDICGQIEKVGSDVDRFKPGDWIYACQDLKDGGAYAGYAVVPESVAARKPEKWTAEQAAAVPLVGLTALQALRDKGGLQPGHKVLVIGASGGVGHIAVQIAKAREAGVAAVCSTANVDWAGKLGADRVIDYKKESYLTGDELYDMVLDTVAASSYGECARILKPTGVYLTTLPDPGMIFQSVLLPIFSRRRARFLMVKPSGEGLDYLADLAERGKLRPVIDKVFNLDEIREAHERSETGRAKGKIVIKMQPEDHGE